MNPPFTTGQFLGVIGRYNAAVWPAQILFYLLAGLMIYWATRASRTADRQVSLLLAFFWAWMGIVYHWIFFTSINPAAWVFGVLFVVQALVFLRAGVTEDRLRFRFRRDAYGLTGAVFLGYALILYPLLGAREGHPYPYGPTVGLPCPTTIATFGLLVWASGRVPLRVAVIPLLWSLIGASAAFQFGIREDYGLLVAGVLGTVMIVVKNRRLPQVERREVIAA
ncbi:MAG TPA: DUF6064 family protein [Longimicrobiales bacterium]|nr:DUF6064 family protein [Longimicrobiales bacterium]